MESDEAFARRLQAQEMGMQPIGDNTPLMMRNENPHAGLQLGNARINDTSHSRIVVFAILFVNIPQILAAFIILSINWNNYIKNCDSAHEMKWRIWSLISSFRMAIYCLIVSFMYSFKPWLDDHPRILSQFNSARSMVDGFGLVWFIVGNMWVFGDDTTGECQHPESSPIYSICVSMLIINYIQICLPCIIAAIMIPIFCFCMPCLIRVMARINNARVVQGAGEAAIDSIPTIIIDSESPESGLGEDASCPICLNEMVTGEEARLLRCKHMFHKQCVDDWLRVNASCPTCRKSILRDPREDSTFPSDAGGSGGGVGATGTTRAGASSLSSSNEGGTGGSNPTTSGISMVTRRRDSGGGGGSGVNSPLTLSLQQP